MILIPFRAVSWRAVAPEPSRRWCDQCRRPARYELTGRVALSTLRGRGLLVQRGDSAVVIEYACEVHRSSIAKRYQSIEFWERVNIQIEHPCGCLWIHGVDSPPPHREWARCECMACALFRGARAARYQELRNEGCSNHSTSTKESDHATVAGESNDRDREPNDGPFR